ncbi:hypothetical protein HYH02_010486 [Chlamydomonas schloesseri]|uniref:Uncharacterized protein n=1 Tax=Chlamydomonas schloesseri TaxID=2026947 RepID=A0A835T6R6_9CHLO|nr:hypothetical protein HYH02_010486 [Chlamydomonas schloesseri]|eukprot:KAG2439854.1 hypothetical protein HYH02_010486 [Chlamydomonas schloesseri]
MLFYAVINGDTCVAGVNGEQATRYALPASSCSSSTTTSNGAANRRRELLQQQRLVSIKLHAFIPASPPPRAPRLPNRPVAPRAPGTVVQPSPPPRPPMLPPPPAPSRQAEVQTLIQIAAQDLPTIQKNISQTISIPVTRSLILLKPTAVPVFTGVITRAVPSGASPDEQREQQQQQLFRAPVIATVRVGHGRMAVFGTESMFTGCCGLGDSDGFDPTEITKIIINTANWTSWYGTKTGHKAILRVADNRLVPIAQYIVATLPSVFATPKEFKANYYLPLMTFANGGYKRCDVYMVLGADPIQRINVKIQNALRSFLEKGKGVLLAGPVVPPALTNTATVVAGQRRRGLMGVDNDDDEPPMALAEVASDWWTLPNLMFGKANEITASGSATAVNESDVLRVHFRELLFKFMELKNDPSTPNSYYAAWNARLMRARADLDTAAIAQFDDALKDKVKEYDQAFGKPPPPLPRPASSGSSSKPPPSPPPMLPPPKPPSPKPPAPKPPAPPPSPMPPATAGYSE